MGLFGLDLCDGLFHGNTDEDDSFLSVEGEPVDIGENERVCPFDFPYYLVNLVRGKHVNLFRGNFFPIVLEYGDVEMCIVGGIPLDCKDTLA